MSPFGLVSARHRDRAQRRGRSPRDRSGAYRSSGRVPDLGERTSVPGASSPEPARGRPGTLGDIGRARRDAGPTPRRSRAGPRRRRRRRAARRRSPPCRGVRTRARATPRERTPARPPSTPARRVARSVMTSRAPAAAVLRPLRVTSSLRRSAPGVCGAHALHLHRVDEHAAHLGALIGPPEPAGEPPVRAPARASDRRGRRTGPRSRSGRAARAACPPLPPALEDASAAVSPARLATRSEARDD